MLPGKFSIFFRAKNEAFGPVETFFESFSSISDLATVSMAKNWYFSALVPVLKVNLDYLQKKNLIF
jgi:hypothetical protein